MGPPPRTHPLVPGKTKAQSRMLCIENKRSGRRCSAVACSGCLARRASATRHNRNCWQPPERLRVEGGRPRQKVLRPRLRLRSKWKGARLMTAVSRPKIKSQTKTKTERSKTETSAKTKTQTQNDIKTETTDRRLKSEHRRLKTETETKTKTKDQRLAVFDKVLQQTELCT